MSSNLFRGCEDSVTDFARAELEYLGVSQDVHGEACLITGGNTCGVSISELLETYPIYNLQRGLFNTWGEITFPWKIDDLTTNLDYSSTDDKWNVATYKSVISYFTGDRVLVIEENGFVLGLYEANQDISSVSGAFDPDKWDKVCQVRTSIPAGIPSLEELKQRYSLYSLDRFKDQWGEFDGQWNENLTEQSKLSCFGQNSLSVIEFEKCLKRSDSDEWGEARIRREFFYREGDVVLVETECADALCLYVALADIPATESYFEQNRVFKQNANWQRVYCVKTGENKCLGYRRTREPAEGYDIVELGSRGHYVELPVPYRLSPPTPSLDQRIE